MPAIKIRSDGTLTLRDASFTSIPRLPSLGNPLLSTLAPRVPSTPALSVRDAPCLCRYLAGRYTPVLYVPCLPCRCGPSSWEPCLSVPALSLCSGTMEVYRYRSPAHLPIRSGTAVRACHAETAARRMRKRAAVFHSTRRRAHRSRARAPWLAGAPPIGPSLPDPAASSPAAAQMP